MDQTQAKALAALQPFVHLATTTKTPSQRFLTDLITRATSAPGTYCFTELLQTPAIQRLRAADASAEAKAYLTLLEIFSWGTYEEYSNTPNLPELNDVQTLKLRQLSLLTLASPFLPMTTTTTDSLTYSSLLASLSLPTAAALESLITASIYSNLLTARLSPTSNPPTVHITSVAPLRDLRPQSLPALLQILQTWESRCTSVITDLESQISAIRSTASTRSGVQKKRQEIVDAAVLNERSNIADGTDNGKAAKARGRLGNKRDLEEHELGGVSEDDGRMDIDEGIGDVGVANVSGRGGSSSLIGSSRGNKRNRGRG